MIVEIVSHIESNGCFSVVGGDNLQNQQIIEAFKSIMEDNRINKIKFLRHLEDISKTGIPEKIYS